MTYKIREASRSNWAAIADVTQIANQQYAGEADPAFWVPYEKSTRDLLLTNTEIVRLAAWENGNLIGSVVYCPPYEREIAGKTVINPHPEMRLLSVLPEHRNKGLAADLISECEKRACEAREQAITLHTTSLMTVAKTMYEKRGYKRFPQIDFEPSAGFVVWGYKKQLFGERE